MVANNSVPNYPSYVHAGSTGEVQISQPGVMKETDVELSPFGVGEAENLELHYTEQARIKGTTLCQRDRVHGTIMHINLV